MGKGIYHGLTKPEGPAARVRRKVSEFVMKKPILVIMAAGMGSRFGGLKQMTAVDAQGHFMMDFSIFDAIRAGFGKVICVIKPEMEADFETKIGVRIRPHIQLVYAYQTLDRLLGGCRIPEGREKPWGTGHAVLCAAPLIDAPFVVINADDFYGREAFEAIGQFLTAPRGASEHAMVGYELGNTLTENGTVSRGVCSVDGQGHLTGIVERTKILRRETGEMAYTEDGKHYVTLPEHTVVSLNFWGFQTSVLDRMEGMFRTFLQEQVPQNPLKAEFYLPSIPASMLADGTGTVQVLSSGAHWYGVTYREDLPDVMAAIQAMKDRGVYPEELWK